MIIRDTETMTHQKTRTLLTLTLCASLSLLATACSGDDKEAQVEEPPLQSASFRLSPAQDCQTLGDRIIDVTTEQILRDRYDHNYRFGVEDNASGNNQAAPAEGGNDGGEESPTDYTTTNNQEEGVDEADFLKTDGDYIYEITGTDVVILDSWPAEQTHEVGRYSLAQGSSSQSAWPRHMFLRDDTVAVLSHIYEEYRYEDKYDEDGEPREQVERPFYGSRLTLLDVSDRANPRLEKQIDIEGWYTNARMIGGDVYMVSNSNLNIPHNIWSSVYDDNSPLPAPEYDADEARQTQLKNIARPILRAMLTSDFSGHDVRDMLPRKRAYNSAGQQILEASLYECTDMYLPDQLANLGVLNITHVDLDEKSTVESTGLLAGGWQIYASQKSLYISQPSSWWWWGWGQDDMTTHIHKFDLDTPDNRPAYAASGEVDGWLLNQFSMSEHAGHLRVATTDNQWTWDEATMTNTRSGGNHVTILKQAQGGLEKTGEIRDLAPGEQIFAARFMGDKGYVVTFEQTDPLFTFDLSDPKAPKLEGELKINGFSSYIHPMGEDHLLTIGQDADDEGRVSGVHLQIFDVSDMKNPRRTYQHKISTGDWSSWSEAMWDHHAFTYHAQKEILAIPVNIHEWEQAGGENFSGLLLLKASKEQGFSEIGRVNHSDLATQYWCTMYPGESWACDAQSQDYYWWTNVRRSIFIEDYVYSFGFEGLKVNDLLAPENEHVSLMLNTSQYGRYY